MLFDGAELLVRKLKELWDNQDKAFILITKVYFTHFLSER